VAFFQRIEPKGSKQCGVSHPRQAPADVFMPKALERKLKRQARKKHLGKKRTAAYVYGTLYKIKKRK